MHRFVSDLNMTTVEDDTTAPNTLVVNVYTPLAATARVVVPTPVFSGRFSFDDPTAAATAKEVFCPRVID